MALTPLLGPPKFGPGVNGQGPVTIRDWEVFYRWLTVVALRVGSLSENETPVGVIDGANLVYTLAQTPNPASSLQIFLSGILALQGTDYTVTGKIVTFVAAPAGGSWLRAFYRY